MRVGIPVLLVCLPLVTAACGGGSPSAPSSSSTSSSTTSTSTSTPTVTLPACATWANTLRATGLPAATGTQATYRDALYAAGGGVKAVGSKSYAVWFPSGWASTSPRRVMVGLHGTDGNAEEDWSLNWKDAVRDRNWAYIGLTYLNASTGAYDDEPAAYTNIKTLMTDIAASCDFGSPSVFLGGFSRGSAMAFGLSYLDAKDRRYFKATSHNSGAWQVGTQPSATVLGVQTRNETTAWSNSKFWMYCGRRDTTHDGDMCGEMSNAKTYVERYGGFVQELFDDPTGGHGGLKSNATALSHLFTYLEGLR